VARAETQCAEEWYAGVSVSGTAAGVPGIGTAAAQSLKR